MVTGANVELNLIEEEKNTWHLYLLLVEHLEGAKHKNIPTKISTTNPSSVTVQGRNSTVSNGNKSICWR
jgi:hypothetical protein